MKFFHLSDLHLGKRYCELPLLEDQRHILNQILALADMEKPSAVLIAGDVYDKSVPPTDAVELFDDFINGLNARGIKVFVISGNHDSAERLAFGARLMGRSGVYISPVFDGTLGCVTLSDEWGGIDIYSLPFIKPATVRRFYEDKIENYTDAVSAVLKNAHIDDTKRNVLIAHQFVTGSSVSGSEEMTVGDVGNVDVSVFAPFDYVALGHIHGSQTIKNVRYCGTPLKYSLSEKNDTKSVTVVELKGKGEVNVSTLPLTPMRDVWEIRGAYAEITARNYYTDAPFRYGLLHIVLTDEEEIPDAMAKLRLIYPDVMNLRYDNARTRSAAAVDDIGALEAQSPYELFLKLFKRQNNTEPTDEQSEFVREAIEKVWGGEQ